MDHAPGRVLTALSGFTARRAGAIIGFWLVVAAALNIGLPQLNAVVAQDSTPILPADSASSQALHKMDVEFGNGRSTSFLFVVLERDSRLTPADTSYAAGLVKRLRAEPDVTFVQDIAARADLRRSLTSKDGQALYFQVGIHGATGAPTAIKEIEAVRAIVKGAAPAGLDVAVTGPAATIADMETAVDHSILFITIATVGIIALLLMLIYRSIAVTALILSMIGLALAVARGTTAWMGLHAFAVSTFTGSFLTAVVLGASTDYAVFLVSRYQELRRDGMEPDEAVRQASGRVAGVIIGSALTVVVANAAMLLASVGIYKTTGPAIAVSIVTTLLMSLTLAPAVLLVAARRGLIEPRAVNPRSARWWPMVANAVVRRPARILVAGLVPLLALAAFYPLLQLSFDERGTQPDSTDSNLGYRLIAGHYPLNEVLPDYILISSDHDLRNAADLAAIEYASRAVAQTPGVVSVRAITRPLGTPIPQASVGYQAGKVGEKLGGAAHQLATKSSSSQQLASGSAQLSDGAGRVAGGAHRAVDGTGRLLRGSQRLLDGLTHLTTGSGTAKAGSIQLRDGAAELAQRLDAGHTRATYAVNGLGQALQALTSSLGCSLDPICARARTGVQQVYTGEKDELLPGLAQAATAAHRIASGSGRLATGLTQIQSGLTRAQTGAATITAGQSTLHDRLGDLAHGADRLAAGSTQVADGTAEMNTSVQQLQHGLGTAAKVLQRAGSASNDPAIGGFYLPPSSLSDPRLATATSLFLSKDGHTARLVAFGDSDAFQRAASERSQEITRAIHQGLAGTGLADADVAISGVPTIDADLGSISDREFAMIAAMALVAVLLILIALLRSLVAPLFLIAAVCLSYAAAMGLGVLVWQLILDRPLDWSVPVIAFILLVAVGADYNLLVMKRMLDESPDGNRQGIATAVSATGRVITAAGLIFAASVFAMMTGTVTTLAQIGFTIGMGLLLDTFVVRTLLVPSVAALLGPRMWWPRQPVKP
ncbi:MAG TPA: MMPL family transporter [Nocardioides sp.]|nr:MMPL family transporter [Nocardioides sp.]